MCVSVDGATRETYEAIRRGASFDQVLGNVRHLVRAREARRQTVPRVRFDVVMMRRNVHELPALVDLAADCGAEAINFFHMVSYEGLNTAHQSLSHDPALSDRWLGLALLAANRRGVTVTAHPPLFAQQATPGGRGRRAFDRLPYCEFPFFHVSMNSTGDVLPCPFSHGEQPYGRVGPETPLPMIWLGRSLHRASPPHPRSGSARDVPPLLLPGEPLPGRSRAVRAATQLDMERREIGRTGVRLSVIGFGTAQLQMLPERKAIAALRRALRMRHQLGAYRARLWRCRALDRQSDCRGRPLCLSGHAKPRLPVPTRTVLREYAADSSGGARWTSTA